MALFRRKKIEHKTFDRENQIPVIKASICNGEQVVGFMNKTTGDFEEVMMIRSAKELESFRETYQIEGEIKKVY